MEAGQFRKTGIEMYKLEKIPAAVFYIPNFVTEEEEELLMRSVYAAPKPKWTQLSNRRLQNWGGLPHPKGMVSEPLPEWLQRVCNRVAELGVFEEFSRKPNHVLVNEYLPGQGIMPHTDGPLYCPTVTTVSLGDHIALDFYRPLDSTSSPPEPQFNDGCCRPSGDEPSVQCSSLAECESSYASLDDRRFTSILLMPRSLVIIKDDMYSKYLHGIHEVSADVVDDTVANRHLYPALDVGTQLPRTKPRVSLTIRVVPKVLQNKLFLGKK